jgi:hypothetical protein
MKYQVKQSRWTLSDGPMIRVIRELVQAEPFRPFVIRMRDGCECEVRKPHSIAWDEPAPEAVVSATKKGGWQSGVLHDIAEVRLKDREPEIEPARGALETAASRVPMGPGMTLAMVTGFLLPLVAFWATHQVATLVAQVEINTKNIERIERRLDAIEARPTPSGPSDRP